MRKLGYVATIVWFALFAMGAQCISNSNNPAAAPTAIPVTPTTNVPALATGPSGPPPDPNTTSVPPAGSCHLINGLPDHACTPGLLNPNVKLIGSTLTVSVAGKSYDFCSKQFSTKLIRPTEAYTGPLKKRLMASYGIEVKNVTINGIVYSTEQFYELDHDASLEDDGHPWAVENLWPQPRRMTIGNSRQPSVPTGLPGPYAEQKDVVENAVKVKGCADTAHFGDYAAQLAYDWTALQGAMTISPDEPTPEPEP